jgi:hypothetical protein
MKNFYFSVAPVEAQLVGNVLEQIDEQGYQYIDSLPIGAARVAPSIAMPNIPRDTVIPLFMVIVCKEFPSADTAEAPKLQQPQRG